MSDLDSETAKVIDAFPELTQEQARYVAASVILTRRASDRVTDLRPEQIPRLTNIVDAMQLSWLKEMQGRLYFPFFCESGKAAIAAKDLPKRDYSKGAKPPVEQLQDALGEDASIVEWPFYPYDEAIAELFYPSPIDGDDIVTLFEASIMIGERIHKSPSKLVMIAPEFFAAELLNGALDPRDPRTRIRWSHQPRQTPDLTWVILPEELQAYALKRWERGVYTDGSRSETP